MEQQFYTDNIERLLKEKSDEFRMYPSKRIWHSLYNNLHPGRKWPSIAGSLLLITTFFFVGFWNSQVHYANTNNLAITKKNSTEQNSTTQKTLEVSLQNNSTEITASNINSILNSTSYTTNSLSQKNGSNKSVALVNNTNNIRTALNKINSRSNYFKTTKSTIPKVELELTDINQANAIVSQLTGAISLPDLRITNVTEINKPIQEENKEKNKIVLPAIAEEENNKLNDTKEIENLITSNSKMVSTEKIIEPNNTETAITPKTKASSIKPISLEDKAWMEAYALNNKTLHGKWKGRLSTEIYITPGLGYRKLNSNTDYNLAVPSYNTSLSNNINGATNTLNQSAGLGFEVGAGITYSVAKNLRIKAGVQTNFTNYVIGAADLNHPVLTTLMLNDLNTGYPYLQQRASSLGNIPGFVTKKIHNQTYQISIPVGVALKLFGNDKLEWYAAATLQPTYVFSGKANLISADHKNYVADASFIRKWNLNSGFETYFHYKLDNYTLQVGPQFRYQIMSTYSKQYTYNENLYNAGLKIGLIKNF